MSSSAKPGNWRRHRCAWNKTTCLFWWVVGILFHVLVDWCTNQRKKETCTWNPRCQKNICTLFWMLVDCQRNAYSTILGNLRSPRAKILICVTLCIFLIESTMNLWYKTLKDEQTWLLDLDIYIHIYIYMYMYVSISPLLLYNTVYMYNSKKQKQTSTPMASSGGGAGALHTPGPWES